METREQQELGALFRDYQKAKRKRAVLRAAQAVGGTAETLRTGRSAAATFADRDYVGRAEQGTYMSPAEKVARKQSVLKDIGTQEMEYYQRMVQMRKDDMDHMQRMAKQELDALADIQRMQLGASQTNANIRARAHADEIDRRLTDAKRLTEVQGSNKDWADGVAGGLKSVQDQIYDQARAALRGQLQPLAQAESLTKEQLEEMRGKDLENALAQREKLKTLRTQARAAGMNVEDFLIESQKESIDRQVQTHQAAYISRAKTALPQKRDDGQLVNTMSYLSAQTGLDPSVLAGGDTKLQAELAADAIKLSERLDKEALRVEELEALRRRTGAGVDSSPLMEAIERSRSTRAAAPPVPQAVARQRGAPAAQDRARVPAQPTGEAPTQAAGQPVPGELAANDPQPAGLKHQREDLSLGEIQGDSYYTLGGVKVPYTSDSMERQRQLLDVIDEFPEHPPVQNLKKQLQENPGYKNYLKDRGYEDNDMAWREFARDMRVGNREKRKEFRKKRRENVLLGKHKGRPIQRLLATSLNRNAPAGTRASTVVAGTDSGAKEKVNDDGRAE